MSAPASPHNDYLGTSGSIAMPPAIAKLPRDSAGRPVPWFVQWVDGKPDFRIMDRDKLRRIIRGGQRCWTCGGLLIGAGAFVIGPMCAVNRTSVEPPSHRRCAVFSAQACPFLTNPNKERRTTGLPEQRHVAGEMIERNPGVTLVWVSASWQPFTVDNGVLFDIGKPMDTMWFAEGRVATRAEVVASIDSGLPILRGMAESEGVDALAELQRRTVDAMRYIPAEVA